jgi:hypothetical protein
MSKRVYAINKGVNAPIEFKGLKGQYIIYLALGLVGILFLFALLYVVGLNTFFCLAVAFGAGGYLFWWVTRTSKRYGQHGLMKKAARRMLPGAIVCRSRKIFLKKG